MNQNGKNMKVFYKIVFIISIVVLVIQGYRYLGILLSEKYDTDEVVVELSELPEEEKKKEIERIDKLKEQIEADKRNLQLYIGITGFVMLSSGLLILLKK